MHTGVQKIKFRKVYKINEKFYTSCHKRKKSTLYLYKEFFEIEKDWQPSTKNGHDQTSQRKDMTRHHTENKIRVTLIHLLNFTHKKSNAN